MSFTWSKIGFCYSYKSFMLYTVHLPFHFFIILFSETSLPLSSFFLSSVLLCGCQSHGNQLFSAINQKQDPQYWSISLALPPNQPQNKKKKNTHTHTHTHKNKQTNKERLTNCVGWTNQMHCSKSLLAHLCFSYIDNV